MDATKCTLAASLILCVFLDKTKQLFLYFALYPRLLIQGIRLLVYFTSISGILWAFISACLKYEILDYNSVPVNHTQNHSFKKSNRCNLKSIVQNFTWFTGVVYRNTVKFNNFYQHYGTGCNPSEKKYNTLNN